MKFQCGCPCLKNIDFLMMLPATDHQIDNQLKEIVWIDKALKIIRVNLSESGINELALSLENARVLEKDIAYWGILVLLEQIKIEDVGRAVNTKYMVERLLKARRSSLLEMINTTQSGRLGILREIFKRRNKMLKTFIQKNIDYLEQQNKETAWMNIRGILNSVRMRYYLSELVFGNAFQLLGNCQRLLEENNLNYAKNNLKSILHKIDKAGYVSFFITHSRDRFVEVSLRDPERLISMEEVFDEVFKAYLKRAV